MRDGAADKVRGKINDSGVPKHVSKCMELLRGDADVQISACRLLERLAFNGLLFIGDWRCMFTCDRAQPGGGDAGWHPAGDRRHATRPRRA